MALEFSTFFGVGVGIGIGIENTGQLFIPICNQDDLYVLYYQLVGNAILICGDLRNQRLILFAFDFIGCTKKEDFQPLISPQ